MTDAWQRCRGHNDGVLAPLDLVDNVYLWAVGESAIAAEAVAALCAPTLDIPLVVGAGPVAPAWVGGATLSIVVDRQGEGAGSGLVETLLERGGPVIGLTGDRALSDLLIQAGQTVLESPPDDSVIPPVVVPLLEALDGDAIVDAITSWSVPAAWTEEDGLPMAIAKAIVGTDVPGVYGSDGVGAVAADWLASQLRLFTGRPAVGASFSEALTHLPAWTDKARLTPVAWLIARGTDTAVVGAFDQVVADVPSVLCTGASPGERLAELLMLADMVVAALPHRDHE